MIKELKRGGKTAKIVKTRKGLSSAGKSYSEKLEILRNVANFFKSQIYVNSVN